MRGFISYAGCWALAVALVVDPAPVLGQSSSPTAPSAAAREAVTQAERLYDLGRLQQAIDGFKRAYELSGDAALLFRLGEVSREAGEDVAALRFYRSYLGRDPRGPHREAADRAARDLERKVEKGPPPAAPSRAPAAAPIVQTRPAPAVVPVVKPQPAAAAVQPPPPPAPSRPPPASLPSVDLQAEATPPATPGPPLPRWLPWVGLGATAGLGAAAAITGLAASHRYDQLHATCGRTAEGCAPGDIDQLKSRALTANLLWAAAGVGALATGVMVYVNVRDAGFAGVWRF